MRDRNEEDTERPKGQLLYQRRKVYGRQVQPVHVVSRGGPPALVMATRKNERGFENEHHRERHDECS